MVNRTRIFFGDGQRDTLYLDNRFYPLSLLLTRLLNKIYKGKRIKFLNIHFYSEESYRLHPALLRNYTHFYNGHLNYNGIFDFEAFSKLELAEQKYLVWTRACEAIQTAGSEIENVSLKEAGAHAHKRGLDINLNLNFRLIEKELDLYEKKVVGAILISFTEAQMHSKFTLEQNGRTLFERHLAEARMGITFFLEMYKGISVTNNCVIIKGHGDVEYFPIKIPIDEELLN